MTAQSRDWPFPEDGLVARPRKPLGRVAAGGFLTLGAGVIASVWLWDWRWAATGLVVLLGAAVVSAVVDARRERAA